MDKAKVAPQHTDSQLDRKSTSVIHQNLSQLFATKKRPSYSDPSTDAPNLKRIQRAFKIQSRHFVSPCILVKLATYRLSLHALTGQTKCKQNQLVGCKFD